MANDAAKCLHGVLYFRRPSANSLQAVCVRCALGATADLTPKAATDTAYLGQAIAEMMRKVFISHLAARSAPPYAGSISIRVETEVGDCSHPVNVVVVNGGANTCRLCGVLSELTMHADSGVSK